MNSTINLLHLTLPANQTTMFFFQNLTAELFLLESPGDSYFSEIGWFFFSENCRSSFFLKSAETKLLLTPFYWVGSVKFLTKFLYGVPFAEFWSKV